VKFIFEENYWIFGIENSSPVVQSRVRVVDTGGARDFQSMPALLNRKGEFVVCRYLLCYENILQVLVNKK
jgi:hypothetical protein